MMIGLIIGGRVHRKTNAREVTYPSTIPALGGLTLEFPGIQLKAVG